MAHNPPSRYRHRCVPRRMWREDCAQRDGCVVQLSTTTPGTMEPAQMPTPVTMYSTTWCGYCRRLKSQMEREGISDVEVDIEQDPEAADLVMQLNGGNQTVPTVIFP